MKPLTSVLIEGVVVGVGLILLFYVLNFIMEKIFPKFSGMQKNIAVLFLSGFLFHIICEYTGVNVWYAKQYCKLL